VVGRDHQAQSTREIRLLDQAQGLGCVGNPAHITEILSKHGEHEGCLKWIVIDKKNGFHGLRSARPNPNPRATSIN
jgi:hypothetical protein